MMETGFKQNVDG